LPTHRHWCDVNSSSYLVCTRVIFDSNWRATVCTTYLCSDCLLTQTIFSTHRSWKFVPLKSDRTGLVWWWLGCMTAVCTDTWRGIEDTCKYRVNASVICAVTWRRIPEDIIQSDVLAVNFGMLCPFCFLSIGFEACHRDSHWYVLHVGVYVSYHLQLPFRIITWYLVGSL
jgi:hypothetical protein